MEPMNNFTPRAQENCSPVVDEIFDTSSDHIPASGMKKQTILRQRYSGIMVNVT